MKKTNNLVIKAFESSENKHEIYILTNKGDFIGSTYLNDINGFMEIDGPVARRGYGKYLFDFSAMYAEELGKKIMSAIDGDTRGGALRQWERLYKEKSVKKVLIPEHLREELYEFTNIEEAPELFYASSIQPSELYLKSKLDNKDVSHFMWFADLKEKYKDVFGTTYQLDCNKWIDEEFPLSQNVLDEVFSESTKKTIKNKIK